MAREKNSNPEDDLTIDDYLDSKQLDALYRITNFNIDNLLPIKKEILNQIRFDILPIHAIDFQELYSYMYPFSYKSYDSTIISYFLENSHIPMILLDGTVYELSLHLRKLSEDIKNIPELLQNDSIFNNPIVHQRIVRLFDQTQLENKEISKAEKSAQISSKILRTLSIHNEAVNRLFILFSKPHFVRFSDLNIKEEAFDFDKVAFEISRKTLDSIRPNSTDNNFVDAINISSVVWMRNNLSIKKYIPYLVTHTPTLLKPEIWIRNEEARYSGISPNIFKSHISAFYLAVIGQFCKEPKGQLEFIESAIRKCEIIQHKIVGIKIFLTPSKKEPKKNLESIWRDSETWMQKLSLIEDIQALNNYFVEPFFSTAENYLAENNRRNTNIRDFFRDEQPDTETLEDDIFQIVEKLRGLIQSVLDLTERTITPHQGERSLLLNSSKEFPTTNIFSVNWEESVDEIDGTKRLLLTSHKKELIAGLENFRGGYYSFYWPTLFSYNKFFQLISEFIKQNIESDVFNKKNSEILLHPSEEFEEEIQGVIFRTNKGTYKRKLNFPLDSSEFFALEKDEVPIFVRVNTIIGDFYLDIFEKNHEKKMIMGIITHVKPISIFTKLFIEGGKFYFWPKLMELEFDKRIVANSPTKGTNYGSKTIS